MASTIVAVDRRQYFRKATKLKYLAFLVCLLILITAFPVSAHQDPFAKKNPVIASVLSLCMVGGGQFYNDQYTKGAMFYTAGLIGSGMFVFSAIDDYNHGSDIDQDNGRGLVGLVIWSVAITASSIEAYYAAKKINERIERFDLSIKPYTSPKARGAMLSLRF